LSTMLRGDDVVGFMGEERAGLGHPAVFAAATGLLANGRSEGGRNPRLAHAAAERCASTSALISATNRSSSHISSSSASSTAVNAPSWLRRSNSWARAAACSDGRNAMISPKRAVGSLPRNFFIAQIHCHQPVVEQNDNTIFAQALDF